MNPISAILGFFGYAKIPKAAVMLSYEQENFLRVWFLRTHERIPGSSIEADFKKHLGGQEVLTKFLRSGRLLS